MRKDRPVALVVEDHPIAREVVIAHIESLGFEVFDAYCAPETMTLLRAHPEIDLLYTDICLPLSLDGVALAKRARALRPHLFIVLSSGVDLDRPLPDLPFLRKPWRRNELARLLERAIPDSRFANDPIGAEIAGGRVVSNG